VRRLYHYVGPKNIAIKLRSAPAGAPVRTAADAISWIRQSGQQHDEEGNVIATFVVDANGDLRIADRRSEHFACAGAGDVQSAGEIAFSVTGDRIKVVWVTNQSTGYCPEPESWPAVQAALAHAGLAAPSGFSPALFFRLCEKCGSINVVKDGLSQCDVCSAPLPADWNFDHPNPEQYALSQKREE
jgi:hypothetical protein